MVELSVGALGTIVMVAAFIGAIVGVRATRPNVRL